jgi:predicted AAA+ superfamily ATPase
MELKAHSSYSGLNYKISYWRTASQIEVDFILGDEIAIEVKSTNKASSRHIKGLKQISTEYKFKYLILISTDPLERIDDSVWFLPWNVFLDKLWSNKLVK